MTDIEVYPNFQPAEHVFDWRDLDGRTLRIHTREENGLLMVFGYDAERPRIYVIAELHVGHRSEPSGPEEV